MWTRTDSRAPSDTDLRLSRSGFADLEGSAQQIAHGLFHFRHRSTLVNPFTALNVTVTGALVPPTFVETDAGAMTTLKSATGGGGGGGGEELRTHSEDINFRCRYPSA
jgi:hypothetical protein